MNKYFVNTANAINLINADEVYIDQNGYLVFHTDGTVTACFKVFDSFAIERDKLPPFVTVPAGDQR